MTRRHLAIAPIVFTALTAIAQEAPKVDGQLQTTKTTLAVSDILALHRGEVDDSVILAKLGQQHQSMLLSTDELIQLKTAGVSDAVVRAMLSPPSQPDLIRNVSEERLRSMSPTGATLSAGAEPADFNDPLLPHESGIYLAGSVDGLRVRMFQ